MWRPVRANQPILAANFPVIGSGVAAMLDPGKESLRARTVTNRSRRLRNRHQILRAGQQEGVALGQRPALVRVAWDPCRRLPADAGDTQAPPQAKGAVSVARAVDEIELWLESVAARW